MHNLRWNLFMWYTYGWLCALVKYLQQSWLSKLNIVLINVNCFNMYLATCTKCDQLVTIECLKVFILPKVNAVHAHWICLHLPWNYKLHIYSPSHSFKLCLFLCSTMLHEFFLYGTTSSSLIDLIVPTVIIKYNGLQNTWCLYTSESQNYPLTFANN